MSYSLYLFGREEEHISFRKDEGTQVIVGPIGQALFDFLRTDFSHPQQAKEWMSRWGLKALPIKGPGGIEWQEVGGEDLERASKMAEEQGILEEAMHRWLDREGPEEVRDFSPLGRYHWYNPFGPSEDYGRGIRRELEPGVSLMFSREANFSYKGLLRMPGRYARRLEKSWSALEEVRKGEVREEERELWQKELKDREKHHKQNLEQFQRWQAQNVSSFWVWKAENILAACWAEVLYCVEAELWAGRCIVCGTYFIMPNKRKRKYCSDCRHKGPQRAYRAKVREERPKKAELLKEKHTMEMRFRRGSISREQYNQWRTTHGFQRYMTKEEVQKYGLPYRRKRWAT